ncbi:(d)CMP kinase [Candidatus Dependentiae bacterium]|nr:(d)CMP kinase [Candidatus Dependentiae bacterium]
MVITIDGPAGSGKSSVAKILADKLDFYYLNTGLLYRAVAFVWLKLNKSLEDAKNLSKEDLSFIEEIKYEFENKKAKVFYDNKNITGELYNITLSKPASILSANKEIRANLLGLQRKVAEKYDIVADGRDCGSVIFPNADYKFYLTAGIDVRAKRIFNDEARQGKVKSPEKLKVELEERDLRDKNRKVSPLIVPKDAIVIDNSNLNLDQTVEKFLNFIKK